MATMKREKKQPLTKLAKAAKTGPPASVSLTDDGLFIDLLLLDEADNNAILTLAERIARSLAVVNMVFRARVTHIAVNRSDDRIVVRLIQQQQIDEQSVVRR